MSEEGEVLALVAALLEVVDGVLMLQFVMLSLGKGFDLDFVWVGSSFRFSGFSIFCEIFIIFMCACEWLVQLH